MHCPPELDALETAAGRPTGHVPRAFTPRAGLAPLHALEAALLPFLRDTPCRIAFSGGRDSSLLLAVATRQARREGLKEPVAVTLRFKEVPGADEAAHQEQVVAHLRTKHWERIDAGDGFDLLGGTALPLLARYGSYYPANAHTFVPLLQGASGGSLVAGFGGDEVFGSWWWGRLHAAGRWDRRRLADAGRYALPGVVRRTLRRRFGEPYTLPWLRADAMTELWRRDVAEEDTPRTFRAALRRTARLRMLHLGLGTLQRFGSAAGVRVAAPLLDGVFVDALARAGAGRGFASRAAAMRAVIEEGVLPVETVERLDKAVFTAALFGPAARTFAAEWSGRGLDEALIIPERVRDAWLTGNGDYRSALLLQAAWRSAA